MKNKEINVNIKLYSLIKKIIVAIIIIVLISLFINQKIKTDEQITLNEALTAEIQVWKGKDGLNRAKITALETQKTETFLNIQTKDSSLISLQKDVNEMKKYLKKQGSVTNFDSNTNIDTSSPTEVVENPETPNFPSYRSSFNLKDDKGKSWVIGESFATKDSTVLALKVKNSYSLVIGRESTGFLGLGKGKPFAQVRNDNPYSMTESLRTYQVSLPPPRRVGISAFGGYVLTSGFNFEPAIGIGLTYTFIKF